jgi:UDP-glucose 4-epimerase
VYGNASIPLSEEHHPEPANLYGMAKWECERIAAAFGVDWTALRIFAGYGVGEVDKGEYASPVTLFLRAALQSRPIEVYGDGTQRRDFVHITTITESLLKSLEINYRGVINVASGESHAFNEVVGMISDLLGTRLQPVYLRKPGNYLESTCADTSKMKGILGVSAIGLGAGLKRYHDALEESHLSA